MPTPEPPRIVKASRAVSARELSRMARTLIDEVERDGSVLALSRHGRMVAVLAPLPERTIVEFNGPGWSVEDEPVDVIEPRPEWSELGDVERALLRLGGEAYPRPFGIDGIPFGASEIAVALGRLELDGLIERIIGGRKLTREGNAAAAWLDEGA